MDEFDNELQYLSKNITVLERKLARLMYHLNHQRQLARRLNVKPDLVQHMNSKPVQMDLFGT